MATIANLACDYTSDAAIAVSEFERWRAHFPSMTEEMNGSSGLSARMQEIRWGFRFLEA